MAVSYCTGVDTVLRNHRLYRLNYQRARNKQIKRTVEVKYGITLHTKQMIKMNELTTGGKTSNLTKHLSLAPPDLFRELERSTG